MAKRTLTTDPSLKDHKRIGKKLVAPLSSASLPGMRSSEWMIERIPEVIWIHELIHHLGPQRSLDILVTLLKAAHSVWRPGDIGLHVLASSWHYMRSDAVAFVVKALRVERQLDALGQGLRALTAFYPQYPLRVLCDNGSAQPAGRGDLASFKLRLQSLFDRFAKPAVMTHAHIVLAQVRAGILILPQECVLPKVDLLYASAPVDEENADYARAAGFVRAAAMGEFAAFPDHQPLVAARYFWSRGLMLEKCGRQREASHG